MLGKLHSKDTNLPDSMSHFMNSACDVHIVRFQLPLLLTSSAGIDFMFAKQRGQHERFSPSPFHPVRSQHCFRWAQSGLNHTIPKHHFIMRPICHHVWRSRSPRVLELAKGIPSCLFFGYKPRRQIYNDHLTKASTSSMVQRPWQPQQHICRLLYTEIHILSLCSPVVMLTSTSIKPPFKNGVMSPHSEHPSTLTSGPKPTRSSHASVAASIVSYA